MDDYCQVIDKIKKEVDTIQESNLWNGMDSNNFVEASNNYLSSFNDVEEILNFYGQFIKQASLIYQTLEYDYTEKSIVNNG